MSFPFVNQNLTERILQFGDELPPAGSFIWAKLPRLNDYLGSETTSLTSSYTAPTPDFERFHMALLVGSTPAENGRVVTVYPTMTFSGKKNEPANIRTLGFPARDQRRLLPLPHAKPENILEIGWRAAITPQEFGEPIDCGEWLDRRASWLWARAQTFDLSFGDTYLVSTPQGSVSDGELARIQSYAYSMHKDLLENTGQRAVTGDSDDNNGPSNSSGSNGRYGDQSGANPSSSNPGQHSKQNKKHGNRFNTSGKGKNHSHNTASSTPTNAMSSFQENISFQNSQSCAPNARTAGFKQLDSKPERIYSFEEYAALFEPSVDDDMELLDSLRYDAENNCNYQADYYYDDFSSAKKDLHDHSRINDWLRGI